MTETIQTSQIKHYHDQIRIIDEWEQWIDLLDRLHTDLAHSATVGLITRNMNATKTSQPAGKPVYGKYAGQIEQQLYSARHEYLELIRAMERLEGYHLVDLIGTELFHKRMDLIPNYADRDDATLIRNDLLEIAYYREFQAMPTNTGVFHRFTDTYEEPAAHKHPISLSSFSPRATVRCFGVFEDQSEAMLFRLKFG